MHVLVALDRTVGARAAPWEAPGPAPAMETTLGGDIAVLDLAETGIAPRGDVAADPAAAGFVRLAGWHGIRSTLVVDVDVTPDVVLDHVGGALARHVPLRDARVGDVAAQLTAEMLSIAGQFPVGTILERDGALLHASIPTLARDGRRPCCTFHRRHACG